MCCEKRGKAHAKSIASVLLKHDISLFRYIDYNRLLICGLDTEKVCKMCCEKRGKAHAKSIAGDLVNDQEFRIR